MLLADTCIYISGTSCIYWGIIDERKGEEKSQKNERDQKQKRREEKSKKERKGKKERYKILWQEGITKKNYEFLGA
jgi:hypothetical protein